METVRYVEPECEVPPIPAVPQVESSKLESLDDETFWTLMDREVLLTNWAFEMEAMLKAMCDVSHS